MVSAVTARRSNPIETADGRDHAVDLQRFLIRRVNHVHDADDLAQEVFARLLRVRYNRPRRRSTKPRDELAPPG